MLFLDIIIERNVKQMDFATLTNFISAFGVIPKVADGEDSPLDKVATVLAARSQTRSTNIRYRAKDLVAQYPVLYSDNVTSQTVQLVNRALEHEYVNLLRLLIQNDNLEDGFKSTGDYLKGFHQNLSHDSNLDPVLKRAGDLEKAFPARESASTMSKAISDVSRELLVPISEDLNYRTLNEDTIIFKEYDNVLTEARRPRASSSRGGVGNSGPRRPATRFASNTTQTQDNNDSKQKQQSSSDSKVRDLTTAKAQVDNVEIKKANELTPTNISVELSYTDKDSKQFVKRNIVFGVKCVAHLLESADIEYYLPNSVITRTPIMRAIQWTSGEIKFFKDFLFAIDEIKKTATKASDRNNFWWRKLQTLSKVASARPMLFGLRKKTSDNPNAHVHAPIPTATMVITKENVDNIKHRHGVDLLSNPSFISKIMKNFFLMTFIIVDESIETVYFYNDETKNFSHYSFKSLEGFSKQKNIDIKDIYSLLK
jgi:hypothetical protein